MKVSFVESLIALASLLLLSSVQTAFAEDDPRLKMTADTPDRLRKTFNEGVELLSMKDAARAADKFQEVIRDMPNFVPAHLGFASCLEEQGRMNDSIHELELASSVLPDNPNVLRGLGRAYQITGQRDKAIKQLDRYVWLYPDGDGADYAKSAVESMKKENQVSSVFADSRGRDDYLEECLTRTVRRWRVAQMPVPIFIDNGEAVAGYRPEYQRIMRQCFEEWSRAANERVSFKFVDRPELALITCNWAASSKELGSSIEAGETQAKGTPGRLKSAKITILTRGADGGAVQNLKGTCLHEVGHALGLGGHSSEAQDIMFMFSKKNDLVGSALTERDKRSILRLYSLSSQQMDDYARHSALDNYSVGSTVEQSAEQYNQLGAAKFALGKFAEAIVDFEQAIKITPGSVMYIQNIGKAYLKLGMQELKAGLFIKAQGHLETAANHLKKGSNPELAVAAYLSLADLARKSGSPADAKMYEAEATRIMKLPAPNK